MVSWEEGLWAVRHSFGSGDDQVELALRPPALSGATELFLFTKPPKISFPSRHVAMSFDAGDERADPFQSFVIKQPSQRVVRWSTNAAVLSRLATAKIMTVRVSGSAYRLMLPNTASELKALDTCQRDLLRQWGLDPAKLAAERRHVATASGDPAKSFNFRDYPGLTMMRGGEGRVVALLSINSTGKPTDCRILNSSANPEFDAKTCAVAKERAMFVPALDAEGKTTASYVLAVR